MWNSSSRKFNISSSSMSKMHNTIETNTKPFWIHNIMGTHKGLEKPMRHWAQLNFSCRLVQILNNEKLQSLLPRDLLLNLGCNFLLPYPKDAFINSYTLTINLIPKSSYCTLTHNVESQYHINLQSFKPNQSITLIHHFFIIIDNQVFKYFSLLW
jgi:hypothetical protein